jgi:hypothetical protein
MTASVKFNVLFPNLLITYENPGGKILFFFRIVLALSKVRHYKATKVIKSSRQLVRFEID